MSRTTAFRRGAAAIGASGLIALSLAGPASARPDPGTGGQHERYSVTEQRWIDPQQEIGSRTSPGIIGTNVLDDGLEYLQLGAGVLAGIALAGAGMAFASRRSHAHSAHPA